MRILLFFIPIVALLQVSAFAEPVGNCSTVPKGAIVDLPVPLSIWGQIKCTPYGYVISANDKWIWTNRSAYSPVFIPAQMVKENPQEKGSNIYFSSIKMELANSLQQEEAKAAFPANIKILNKPDIYILSLKSVSQDSLKIYF